MNLKNTKRVQGIEVRRQIEIEQYKTYIGTLSILLSQREWIDKCFLSVHTILLSILAGFVIANNDDSLGRRIVLGSVFALGIGASWAWRCFLIRNRKRINTKYKIITDMERRLYIHPFTDEWDSVQQENKRTKIFEFQYCEGIANFFMLIDDIILGYLILGIFKYWPIHMTAAEVIWGMI